MSRIVRERYPVADLPDDLREMVSDAQHVRLVIEPSDEMRSDPEESSLALRPPDRVMSIDELFALRRPPYRTTEEIVDDVRRQRDEWDD